MASKKDNSDSIHIGGVPIKFPCKPYGSQLSMMAKIVRGIDRRQNCLLESPTGSGKSLALLCSSLGWQKHEYEKQLIAQRDVSTGGDTELPTALSHCTLCHCHSKQEGEQDTLSKDLPQDGLANTSDKPTVDNVSTMKNDDDDSDIFQTDQIKFRTPGSKARAKQLTDEDEASKSRCVAADKKTTSGEKLFGVSCSCACHSPDKKEPCMEATDEEEPIRLPKIYFGTRTHKQIAQIIRELKRTAYSEVKMAILGSREHLCVHPEVSRSKNKNDGCRELLDTKTGISCRYYANVQKIKHHWQLEGHGLTSAWDVEDLVKLGKKIKSCPYFATRSLANDADVIFCPYNYLIDPLIRSSMDITLKDQIIILDEAHNIEDSAREAASATIRADELQDVMDELDKLIQYKWREEHCRAMHVVAANLQRWIASQSGSLSQNDFNKASKVWSGVEMVAQFNNMGVSPGTFDVLKHNLAALFEEPNPQIPVEQMMSLTSASGMLLRGLFIIVDYFFRENMVYMKDYKVVMIKEFNQRKGRDNTDNRWLNPRRGSSERLTYSLNFWCMNPAVAFSDVGGEARTIVLTSGTLSPMGSFASELGVEFSISLEANHVIKDSQVWVGSIATGPTGKTLNASYKNTETFNFQDDLGRLVLDVCKTIPFGVLCFFSSYSLMLKLSERWKNTGLWSEISEKKMIMTEARGGMKKEFDEQLKEFYSTIEDFESSGTEGGGTMTGVLFLAVCRGKVSEGMDFADNNARAVITVGIPFPSFKDPQVELKRAYNDQNRDRGLLSGSEWYEIQAYRALNQALGRCLRHRNDWGALILVDERFRRNPQKYISGLSKWVRHKVNHFLHSRDGVDSLKNFVTRQQKISELSDSQRTSPAGSQTFHDPSSTLLPSSSEGTSCSSHPATPTTPRHLVSTPLQFNKFAKPIAVMHGFHAISLKDSRFDKSSPQSTNRFQTPTGKKPNSYTSHCVSEEKLPATISQKLAHTPSRSVHSVLPTMCLDSDIVPLKNGPYYHCADISGTDKGNTNCLPNSGGLSLTPEETKTNMKSEPTIIPSSASETNVKSSQTPKPLRQQSLSSFMHSPNSGKGLLKKLTFSDKTHQSNTECEMTTCNVAGWISPDEGEEEIIKEKESLTENTTLQNVKAEEVHVEEPAGTPPSLFPEDSAEVDDTTTVNYLSVKEVEVELLDQDTQIVVENEEDTSLLHEEETSQETLQLNEEVTVDKNDNSIHDTPSVTKKQSSKLNNGSVRRSTRSKLKRRSTSSKKEQTPLRKRTCCDDDEETEEQEDTLIRKSKRSKKDSSLTVKERMNLNPDVLDVSCPSCGNIICKSGITEVPANVITSTYLLEQLALKAEPVRRTSPRKRTVSNVRNDAALRVCPDSPVNVVVPYVKKKGPDVYKLNAHWSEEDDCCFQPVFCPDCADTKNGSSSAIGHKVVCVGQTKQIFNLGEIWFQKK